MLTNQLHAMQADRCRASLAANSKQSLFMMGSSLPPKMPSGPMNYSNGKGPLNAARLTPGSARKDTSAVLMSKLALNTT